MYTVGTIPTLRSWEAGGKAMGLMTFFCRDTMSDADKTREPKHFVTFAPGSSRPPLLLKEVRASIELRNAAL